MVCIKEMFDARHALVGIHWIEGWEVPSLGEVAIDDEIVVGFAPVGNRVLYKSVIWRSFRP